MSRWIFLLLITCGLCASEVPPQDDTDVFHTVKEKAFYAGTGAALGTLALFAKAGSEIARLFDARQAKEECAYLSNICTAASQHLVAQIKNSSKQIKLGSHPIPASQLSWHLNQHQLSEIPAFSKEERELLLFLEKRWLAKSTGFFSTMIRWALPCFGINLQVHPETTCSYARMPSTKLSQTYNNRVETWKKSLPHPFSFPLILTRPSSIREYLPPCIAACPGESIKSLVRRIGQSGSKVVLDITALFPEESRDKKEWQEIWENFREAFVKECPGLSLNNVLCIQTLKQKDLGGIRLLPLSSRADLLDEQYRFLLKWVSTFGLTANRIELDRISAEGEHSFSHRDKKSPAPQKEQFLEEILQFEKNWKSPNPQTELMVGGTVKLLKALLSSISHEKWTGIRSSLTKSHAAQLAFTQISSKLQSLEGSSFFEIASQLEEVHASLSTLLEIFSPFTLQDFPAIYQNLLSIPTRLYPLTQCAIHSSGMISVAGICKAVERMHQKAPHIFYGENAYFECIHAAEWAGTASATEEASEKEWQEVDLILAQFNPALKRIETNANEYKVERVAQAVRHALAQKRDKTLVVAIDCTLDLIDSPKVKEFLKEFQKEILSGNLCVITYRSGLKFDLFGMDNYCGAPIMLIHNQDSKWEAFDLLLSDPALQADRLSANWFCLAYANVSNELEEYRKQIFNNTRALLQKIPPALFGNAPYRVVPIAEDAEAAFVDIKISGPFHQIRGSTLVAGSLMLNCFENGHPIFLRPSVGFYHPNFTMLFSEENTTVRLTLGLDPTQVDILAACLEKISALKKGEDERE